MFSVVQKIFQYFLTNASFKQNIDTVAFLAYILTIP